MKSFEGKRRWGVGEPGKVFGFGGDLDNGQGVLSVRVLCNFVEVRVDGKIGEERKYRILLSDVEGGCFSRGEGDVAVLLLRYLGRTVGDLLVGMAQGKRVVW